MKKILLILLPILTIISAFTSVMLTDWRIDDENYVITFKTKGVKGGFKGLKGGIHFLENDLSQSKFDVTVDVNTISTGIGMKNKHALAEDFFDAGHYPTIHFVSSAVIRSDTSFVVKGYLTMKDVTHEISFPFTFKKEEEKGIFKSEFEINRKDYNLDKKGIGEIIQIKLNVPVKQQD